MLGSIRILKTFLVDRIPGCWGPAADEAVTAFRPLPWELGRYGWLNRRALRAIAHKAGRHWLCVAGPRIAVGRIDLRGVEEAQASGGCGTFERLTVRTRLAGYEKGCRLLCHVVEGANGRQLARLTSRVALSHEAEWAAFPPYPATQPVAAEA